MGKLQLLPGSLAAAPDFSPSLTEKQEKDLSGLTNLYLKQIFAPPEWEEAAAALHLRAGEAAEYLGWLLDQKRLKKIGGVFFAYDALEQAEKVLRARYPQTFTIAEARDLWGTSRKYAQLLLDTLDAQGITKRDGDRRVFLK